MRSTAVVVVLSLVLGSPGAGPYQALAATRAVERTGVRFEPGRVSPGSEAGSPLLELDLSPTQDLLAEKALPAPAVDEALSLPPLESGLSPSRIPAKPSRAAGSEGPRFARPAARIRRNLRELAAAFSPRRTAIAAATGLALVLGSAAAPAAVIPARTPAQASLVRLAAAEPEEPAAAAPLLEVSGAAFIEREARLGDTLHLVLTLKNPTSEFLDLAPLKESLQRALPEGLEIQGPPLAGLAARLAPGREIRLEIPVEVTGLPSGDALAVAEKRVPLPSSLFVNDRSQFRRDAAFNLPSLSIPFKSRLAGKEDEDFHPAKTPRERRMIDGGALLALGALTALAAWLAVRLRRLLPRRGGLPRQTASASKLALDRLEALRNDPAAMSDAGRFYPRLWQALSAYLEDALELPRKVTRTPGELLEEAARSSRLSQDEKNRLAEGLAPILARAFDSLSDPRPENSPSERLQADLAAAKAWLAGPSAAPAPRSATLSSFAFLALPGLEGFHLQSPEFMLLLLPAAIPLVWRLFSRKSRALGVVREVTTDHLRPMNPWSVRLRRALGAAIIALPILAGTAALVGPVRTVAVEALKVLGVRIALLGDGSGSMGSPMEGSTITKIEALKAGYAALIDDQAKGTTNQIALSTFDTDLKVISPFTSYLKVVRGGLSFVEAGGGTDIEKALLLQANQFIKRNIVDIDENRHPEAAKLKALMRKEGLTAALEALMREPPGSPLWDLVWPKGQANVIVLSSDGDSSGDPLKAAKFVAALGIRIYTIGIPASDLNEKALQDIAAVSGGFYRKSTGPQALTDILLDISRLVKSPITTVTPTVVSYEWPLAVLSFGGVLVMILFSRGRKMGRFLPALAGTLLASQLVLPVNAARAAEPLAPAAATVSVPASRTDWLGPFSTLPELREGAELYRRGSFLEALRSFSQAAQKRPDLPEPLFDMGTAALALGDLGRADTLLKAAAALAESAGRFDLAGAAYYQRGMAALAEKDLEGAVAMFKLAHYSLPGDSDVLENWERAERLLQKARQQRDKPSEDARQGQEEDRPQDAERQRRSQQRRDDAGRPQPGAQPGDKPGNRRSGPAEERMRERIPRELRDAEAQRSSPSKPIDGKWAWLIAPLAGLAWLSDSHPVFAAGAAAEKYSAGWSHPAWLVVAAVALAAALLWIIRSVRRAAKDARAVVPGRAPERLSDWGGRRREFLRSGLSLTALASFGMAAGLPVVGTREVPMPISGRIDWILAKDVSRSVTHLEDGSFEASQAEDEAWIQAMRRSTNQARLAVFGVARDAGAAVLSPDLGSGLERLYDLIEEGDRLGAGDSFLDLAVERAVQVFEAAENLGPRERMLLLKSDGGEAWTPRLDLAVRKAKAKGVTIHTVLTGSPSGARMLWTDRERKAHSELGRFIEDPDRPGHPPAVVRSNAAVMDRIARETGGIAVSDVDGRGMSRLMEELSSRRVGRVPTALGKVLAPNPISKYFILPGVAALIARLFVREKSMTSSTTLHSFALLPLAFMFGGAGPVDWSWVLPATGVMGLTLGLTVSGLLAYALLDVIRRAGLTRDVVAMAYGRLGLLRRALRRDAPGLLLDAKARPLDAKRLGEFLEAWSRARSWVPGRTLARREKLIASVTEKDPLWREKLVAAYLEDASAGGQEAALARLDELGRRSLLPLGAVVERLLSRREAAGWLALAPVLLKLAALTELAGRGRPESDKLLRGLASHPDARVRQAAWDALDLPDSELPRESWGLRLSRIARASAVGLLLASSLAWNWLSAANVIDVRSKAEQGKAAVLESFFGEDAFVLTRKDQYTDPVLSDRALPLLSRWASWSPKDRAELEGLLPDIEASADPNALNVLIFLHRQRGVYQLPAAIDDSIVQALVRRDNEEIWASILGGMNRRAPTAEARALLSLALDALKAVPAKQSHARLLLLGHRTNHPEVRAGARAALEALLEAPENREHSVTLLKDWSVESKDDAEAKAVLLEVALKSVAFRDDLPPSEQKLMGELLPTLIDAGDDTSSPEKTRSTQLARGGVAEALAKTLAELPPERLAKAPAVREAAGGIIDKFTGQILDNGQSIFAGSDMNHTYSLAGVRNLSTVVSGAEFARDGRLVFPHDIFVTGDPGVAPKATFSLSQIRKAAEIFRGMLADGRNWRDAPLSDKERAYLEGSIPAFESLLKLGTLVGAPEEPKGRAPVVDPARRLAIAKSLVSMSLSREQALMPGSAYFNAVRIAFQEGSSFSISDFEKVSLERIRAALALDKQLLSQGFILDGNDRKPLTRLLVKALQADVTLFEAVLRDGAELGIPETVPRAKSEPASVPSFVPWFLLPFFAQDALPEPTPFFGPAFWVLAAAAAWAAVAGAVLAVRLGVFRFSRLRLARLDRVRELQERREQIEVKARLIARSPLLGELRSRLKDRDSGEQVDTADYEAGDPRIDHIETAKTGDWKSKVFEQRRDVPVILVVNLGATMLGGSRSVSKRRVAEDAAGAIALAAADDAAVGLLLVSDDGAEFVRPQRGAAHAMRLYDKLLDFRPKARPKRTRWEEALAQLSARVPGPSIVVAVSDFLSPGHGELLRSLKAAGHLPVPVVVQDPFEWEPIPKAGVQRFQGPLDHEPRWFDTSSRSFQADNRTAIQRRLRNLTAWTAEAAVQEPLRLPTEPGFLDRLVDGLRDTQASTSGGVHAP